MKPRRLGLWIPWSVFALCVIGWTVYWNVLAHAARTNIEAAISAERARGAQIEIGAMNARGFPLQFALDCSDLSYAPADGAFSMMTQRLVVHVNVLNPQHVIVAFPQPLAITKRDGRVLSLSGADALMSVHMNGRALVRASFETNALRIADPAKPGEETDIGRAVLNLRPDPRTAGAYQLAAQFQNITLAKPVKAFEALGQTIATLDAAIVIDHGAALIGAPRGDALGPWARAGGNARLEGFGIAWGAAHGSGTGALTLDQQRRLQGGLTLRLDNPGATLGALANSQTLSQDAKRALQIAAFAYEASGDAIELPLRAQDGGLFLGPARLRDLEPLYHSD